jgi:23S rRNA (cytidine1920-2'-O)/16S rRNA (cytidine1409-2'-O)-methyltransferase
MAATDSNEKIRLDRLLVERGLVPARERARALILAGQVLVNGTKVDKVGMVELGRILKTRSPYVSRGGEIMRP